MIEVGTRPAGATRLVIVRHTETDEAAQGMIYGATDVALSSGGVRHAARLGAGLAPLDIAAVYASPRTRTRQTAAALGLPVQACDALREIAFGDLEGQTYDAVREEMPELYATWMTRPTEVRFPGGESFADLRMRTVRASRRLRTTSANRTLALVTHGGVARALLADALSLRDEHVFRLDQRYGAINVVDYFDDVPVVRLMNGAI